VLRHFLVFLLKNVLKKDQPVLSPDVKLRELKNNKV